MPLKQPFTLKVSSKLPNPKHVGLYKEAAGIIAKRHDGEMFFDPQTFDGVRFQASFAFASQVKMEEFRHSIFMRHSKQFLPREKRVDPERLSYHVGLIPEVMHGFKDLRRDVVFLPQASLDFVNLTYFARSEKTAACFEEQMDNLAAKHMQEAEKWNTYRQLHDIARRGQGILQASLAAAPRGPLG